MLGTIASQFVTGIAITDAGTHDALPTMDLLDQAAQMGVKPKEALGDGAYGTGANLRACKAAGVDVRTRLPTPSKRTAIPKMDFIINVDAGTVTCPEGHLSSQSSMVKDPDDANTLVARHHFDRETCQACPLKASCSTATAKGGARTLALSRYEPEHQAVIAFNKTPEAADVLRTRSAVERLISHLVRMGMRHARFFGMHMVHVSSLYDVRRLQPSATHQPEGEGVPNRWLNGRVRKRRCSRPMPHRQDRLPRFCG